jgi:hypothetical protein
MMSIQRMQLTGRHSGLPGLRLLHPARQLIHVGRRDWTISYG